MIIKNKNKLKLRSINKILVLGLILIVLVGLFGSMANIHASSTNPNEACNSKDNPTNKPCVQPYVLLAPLSPELAKDGFNPAGDNVLGTYLNLMLKIFIGLCAVLSVIMIVIGGIEYMTSELVSSKEAGKERMTHAILGLLVALGAYALLNTINPNLLKTDLGSLKNVTVDVELKNDSVWQSTGSDGKYTNGGLKYTPGEAWINNGTTQGRAGVPKSAAELSQLNVKVYNAECATVGQASCTSTAGLDLSILTTIHNKCPACDMSLQGGVEFWAHGGSTGGTSHGIGSPTVDLGLTTNLGNYIKGGTQIAPDRWTRDGVSYFYEGNHWHVYK